jgi:hypothetical protein
MKKIFKVIPVSGRQHVVTNIEARGKGVENANYMGTGMALCGVLKEGEALHDWKKRTRN